MKARFILPSLACCLLLGACSPLQKVAEAPVEQRAVSPLPNGEAISDPNAIPRVELGGSARNPNLPRELSDPSSPLARRSIHFAYDHFEIGDTDLPTLQAHARFLGRHPQLTIRIEGNADERGSTEYNQALGNRRAQAVRSALVTLGVGASRIEAVSFGELKPRGTGHDEASWAENRRADIRYDGE